MRRSEEEPKTPPIRERNVDLCRDRGIERGVCLRERWLSHGRETKTYVGV